MSLFLVIFGIASRFLPHPSDTTPITAIILFASAYLGFRYSAFILFAAMIVTDIFIGFYDWRIMLAVYGSFALAGVIGLFMRKKRTAGLVFSATFISSSIFFLITNWAVWQFGSMYAHSFAGLVESYAMGLPFFRNSLMGDLFYSGFLFGAYELASSAVLNFKQRRIFRRNQAKV